MSCITLERWLLLHSAIATCRIVVHKIACCKNVRLRADLRQRVLWWSCHIVVLPCQTTMLWMIILIMRVVIVIDQGHDVRREHWWTIQMMALTIWIQQVATSFVTVVLSKKWLVVVGIRCNCLEGWRRLMGWCRQLEVLTKEGALESTESCFSDWCCMLLVHALRDAWRIEEAVQAHVILHRWCSWVENVLNGLSRRCWESWGQVHVVLDQI